MRDLICSVLERTPGLTKRQIEYILGIEISNALIKRMSKPGGNLTRRKNGYGIYSYFINEF